MLTDAEQPVAIERRPIHQPPEIEAIARGLVLPGMCHDVDDSRRLNCKWVSQLRSARTARRFCRGCRYRGNLRTALRLGCRY
jgi:hypothetical protein